MKKLKNSELNRISLEEFKNSSKTPIKVVLDNIRSAHNVGSIFRTCDAFLIDEIILCGITAVPPNNEIRKTALGSTESLKWTYVEEIENTILKLKSENYHIVSIEQANKSTPLENFSLDSDKKYQGQLHIVPSEYPYQKLLKSDKDWMDWTYENKCWDYMVKNFPPSDKNLFWPTNTTGSN